MAVNADVTANTAMPMFLSVVRQKCTYGNMAGNELFCVRVATLLRKKYANIPRVMSKTSTFRIVKIFILLF